MRHILRDPLLWKGLALLFGGGLTFLLLFNYVIMPAYTRQHEVVLVPDVSGLPYEEAAARLQEYGLKPVRKVVAVYSPDQPRGIVLDQNPRPGYRVKPGRRIYLTVSSDSIPQVIVPDVRDLSLREARLRLEEAGLEIGDVRVDSLPSPYANTVTNTEPAPGDTVAQGTAITVWISPGPSVERVRVPDVRDLPVARADSLLLSRGLRPVHLEAEAETFMLPGTVVDQDPPPGTRLRKGSEVRLYVTTETR